MGAKQTAAGKGVGAVLVGGAAGAFGAAGALGSVGAPAGAMSLFISWIIGRMRSIIFFM